MNGEPALALTCRDVSEILVRPPRQHVLGGVRVGVHRPFARVKDLLGVGMAKALLGQRVYMNDRLILESARLRSRVRDLECMIEDLQNDNDRLRADHPAEMQSARQPAY